MMCGALTCATGEASVWDYLAFLAGDEDFELTIYGVRKTEVAIERDKRENEHRIRVMAGVYETNCARLEDEVKTAREAALRYGDAARNAPGGIKGVAAQTALTGARASLRQMARLNVDLRQEYTRLEQARAALEAIRARSAAVNDARLFDVIRTSLHEARVPREQLEQIAEAGRDTLRQFAQLESQNLQYNTMMESFDKSLIETTANVGQGQFAEYNLGETDSLLSALDSIRADSHHDSVALDSLYALPMPAASPSSATTPLQRTTAQN